MTLRVGQLPANVALLAFGWSRLPSGIDLAGVGMPGCVWYTTPEVLVPIAATNGWGRIDVTIPNVPSLLGATWFNQAIVFDPAANAPGLAVSEPAEAIVGG
jgi:hypothetical protein